MQPPSSAAIDAAFAGDLHGFDWFDARSVAMLRSQVCQWIEKGRTGSGSDGSAGTPRPPIELRYIGAAWVALMASRDLVDPASRWLQRQH